MNPLLPEQFLRFSKGAIILSFGMALTGCSALKPGVPVSEAAFHPQNVYAAASTLPEQVKRVAVLPITADESYSSLREGCEALEPVLNAELIKARRFEAVRVTPQGLGYCTGRTAWTAEESLPAEMLSALRETYGCDAVLFSQLTVFRAQAPLAIGWRLKLVDANSREILWAADEVFDADDNLPQAPAWPWSFPVLIPPSTEELARAWRVENSPRIFAQITLDQLLATLPAR